MACENVAEINIECVVQNQAFTALLVFENEDTGDPIDLSVYPSAFFDVFAGTSRVDRLTYGDGLSVSGATITISLSQTRTAGYALGSLRYELRLVNAEDENFYVSRGSISGLITRSR